MGVDSKELSFNLSCVFVPKSISDFLGEVSGMKDTTKKLSKLNDYVHLLEEELRKIDAFKRELPLSVLLLSDAIGRLKEEVVQCEKGQVRPIIEEFIPLKVNSDSERGTKGSSDFTEKKNWMSSAQLWSTPVQYDDFDFRKEGSVSLLNSSHKNDQVESCNFKKKAGAFLPFKKQSDEEMKGEEESLPYHGLSLSIPVAVAEVGSIDFKLNDINGLGDHAFSRQRAQHEQQQQQRKQRRCWSPELHKRFVDALQQLGGAQAATPKQIRELMQVDGLTNDEVKSHLQKYRLHFRRLPNSSGALSTCSWLVRDECGNLSKANNGQSGSPEGPLHLGGFVKGVSVTGGDSMEDEEEEKSESHSWKGQGRLQKPVEEDV